MSVRNFHLRGGQLFNRADELICTFSFGAEGIRCTPDEELSLEIRDLEEITEWMKELR